MNRREIFWGAKTPDLQCKDFQACPQRKYPLHISEHVVCFSLLHVISGIDFVFLWVLSLKVKEWKTPQIKVSYTKYKANFLFYAYSLWEFSCHCLKSLQSFKIRAITTLTWSMSNFIWKEEIGAEKTHCLFFLCRLSLTWGSIFFFKKNLHNLLKQHFFFYYILISLIKYWILRILGLPTRKHKKIRG